MSTDYTIPQHRLAVQPGEAADLAGVSRTKLFELLREGTLPSLKVGRRRLVLVADLLAFLENERDAQLAESRS